MKVEEIMTKDVITAHPSTSLVEIIRFIDKNQIHSVPIVDDEKKLLGIVTEMDFFIKDPAAGYLPSHLELFKKIKSEDSIDWSEQKELDNLIDLQAQDIMTTDCVTVSSNTEVKDLMKTFKETRFKSFPVVDGKKHLIGIVSLVDVIESVEI